MPAKGWRGETGKTGPRKIKTDHEEAIDQFIPTAEMYADDLVPNVNAYQKGRDDWSRLFISRMNQCTIAAGLRVPFGKEGG